MNCIGCNNILRHSAFLANCGHLFCKQNCVSIDSLCPICNIKIKYFTKFPLIKELANSQQGENLRDRAAQAQETLNYFYLQRSNQRIVFNKFVSDIENFNKK